MSATCSTSECSSGYSCAAPTDFFSLGMRDNAFPFPAQPLVYYAGVPEVYSERQKGREKSDKPNCFVKAFRWYTQEHGTKKSTADKTKDVGFASWLDYKYQQYLYDSQLKNASFKSEAYFHSPVINQESASHKSVKPKGFQKVLKSPWRKRRAAAKSPEGGNTCTESSSWQILLRPKSLSHLESETCAKKQSTTFGASSRVTVTSSDTLMTVRTYSTRIGIVVQEVTNSNTDNIIKKKSKKINALDSQNTYVIDKNCTDVTNSKIKVKCECPVEPNVPNETGQDYRTDASTQYDPYKNFQVKPLNTITTTRGTSQLNCCTSAELMRPSSIKNTSAATPKEKHIKIDIGDKTKLKSPCTCEPHTPVPSNRCHHACNNDANYRRQVFQNHQESQRSTCYHMRSANGSAQTSDYAITITPPDNVACGLPLLLRVLSPRQ